MRNLLTQYGIPDTNLRDAVEFLNVADGSVIESFTGNFGLNLYGNDALTAARFATDAILRGAATEDKVKGYVSKMMTGGAARVHQRVTIVGAPVVETDEVVIAPVEPVVREEVAPAIVVKGRKGRKRLGNSDFCKIVPVIEGAPKDAGRQGILNAIMAAGIKESSAKVYLWRYNNGERE